MVSWTVHAIGNVPAISSLCGHVLVHDPRCENKMDLHDDVDTSCSTCWSNKVIIIIQPKNTNKTYTVLFLYVRLTNLKHTHFSHTKKNIDLFQFLALPDEHADAAMCDFRLHN